MRLYRPIAIVAAVAAAAVIWPATAHAATLVVGPGGGTGQCASSPFLYPSLHAAAVDAAGGDTVVICPGIYSGADNVGEYFAGAVTIVGAGPSQTIFDAEAAGRVVTFGDTASVSGITFRNGADAGGAAISTSAGSLLTITDCAFVNNTSAGDWGGAILAGGNVTIAGSTFTGNASTGGTMYGGAVFSEGVVTITSSTFSGNSASSYGGAVAADLGVVVSGSSFSGNSATTQGGAIFSATAEIDTSEFTSNTSANGGAVSVTGGLTIGRSTFSQNSADQSGGAVRATAGPIQSWNSTFSQNAVSIGPGRVGGALYTGGTAALVNLTFVGNAAPSGGGASISAAFFSAGNVIFGDETSGACRTTPDALDWSDGGGNLAAEASCPGTSTVSADLALGTLADNGGPTPTVALGAASVAIDAGVAASCADSPVSGIDQRGYARAVGACDSGAFEYGAGPAAVKPPPSWLLATTRPSSEDICPTGSNPSWAYWPNEGTGGFTCESSIVFDPRTGTWVPQAGLANG